MDNGRMATDVKYFTRPSSIELLCSGGCRAPHFGGIYLTGQGYTCIRSSYNLPQLEQGKFRFLVEILNNFLGNVLLHL